MRLEGILIVALACALGGCRWPPEAPGPYTSAIAEPTAEDAENPPEHLPLACTDAGYTLVLGPGPGCAALEDLAASGRVLRPDVSRGPFGGDSDVSGEGTALRVIRRGGHTVDVEVVVRCRPFYNDDRNVALFRERAPDCSTARAQLASLECEPNGTPFQQTLGAGEESMELMLFGEGALVDFRACTRSDP